jgi:peroxiredoxin Q/BCP
MKRAFLPLGEICTSPSARGPLSAGGLRPSGASVCAASNELVIAISPAKMTAYRPLRYNHDLHKHDRKEHKPPDQRRGEAPMEVNDKSPDFSTTDENGKEVASKDFRGKTVVLYFYPKADTPGCTKEACSFRDSYSAIKRTGAVLLGISKDTSASQKKFQDKFSLPFPLLADPDKKIANLFGVVKEKNMYGKKVEGIARTTFVIGPDGKIKHIFNNVKPEGHAEEVLAYLKSAA